MHFVTVDGIDSTAERRSVGNVLEVSLSLLASGEAELILHLTVSASEPLASIIEVMAGAVRVQRGAQRRRAVSALLTRLAAESLPDQFGSEIHAAPGDDAASSIALREWIEATTARRNLADRRIIRAVEAIHCNPGGAWAVAKLAAVAGMSRTAFIERFAWSMGMPPARYLATVRAKVAIRLIRSGALSLAEIADGLGYSDVSAFSRAFRKWTGITPGALRDRGRCGRSPRRDGAAESGAPAIRRRSGRQIFPRLDADLPARG